MALLALAGCAVFEPRYSETALTSMESAYSEVSTLVAATDLGQFGDPSSYDGAADRYAGTIGQIALARQSVAVGGGKPGSPASKASELMLEQIDACTEAVTLMANQHRQGGLTAGAGYGSARIACAIPLTNMQN